MNRLAVSCCILLASFSPASHTALAASEGAAHHPEQQHEYHRNALFGFFGLTGEDRRERAGTIALEYERRFDERWGLAAGAEHAFGDLDFTVYTVPAVFHSGNWSVYAGPGIEKPKDHGSEFLVRAGVAYEFEKGDMLISPKLNVDFVDEEAVLVVGIAIGFGF
jgi:hypothetical protein